jgi:Family of unknown function (DUF6524)
MFTWVSFLIRWLGVATVVFATYNPSGYSYVHWLGTWQPNLIALKIAAGLTLVGAYWLLLFATWLVLRVLGLFLLGATVLALAAGAWQLGLVPTTSDSLQFLLLATIATYLTIGLCYAHMRSRLTGQIQSRILSEPAQVQEPQEPLV